MSFLFFKNPAKKRWHSSVPQFALPRGSSPHPPESVRTAFARSLARSYGDVITKSSRLDGFTEISKEWGSARAPSARGSSAIKKKKHYGKRKCWMILFLTLYNKFIVNKRTDTWKTDINLFFLLWTNCQIVLSRSLKVKPWSQLAHSCRSLSQFLPSFLLTGVSHKL